MLSLLVHCFSVGSHLMTMPIRPVINTTLSIKRKRFRLGIQRRQTGFFLGMEAWSDVLVWESLSVKSLGDIRGLYRVSLESMVSMYYHS